MQAYKLTLTGQGGELDSHTVTADPDDTNALREALVSWLEDSRSVLAAGDTITIVEVEGP